MSCFRPFQAWQLTDSSIVFKERGDVARSLMLPCGVCVGCKSDRARAWGVRIVHEAQMHDFSWFITLTYSPDKLRSPSLDYSDFQRFMKRVRKYFGRVRFFVAGEYGGQLGRPHFHAVLFGLTFPDMRYYRQSPSGFTLWRSDVLDALWSHGLCSIGVVNFQTASYVAKYLLKKVTGDDAADHYRRYDPLSGEVIDLVPEFCHMSLKPGIGKSWYDKYGSTDALPRDFVRVNGVKCPVPKYYSRMLKERDPFLYDAVEYERYVFAVDKADDRTPERLAVREICAYASSNNARNGPQNVEF